MEERISQCTCKAAVGHMVNLMGLQDLRLAISLADRFQDVHP